MSVVVVGGGWAGCAAAYAAARAGARVTLLEKTDLLLGTGLVGGILRNNGRFTAAEELRAMGGGSFLRLVESVIRHENLDFPGHRHAALYDVTRIEPVVRRALLEAGVDLRLQARVVGVIKKGARIAEVYTAQGKNVPGDVFIDATGTAGPVKNCTRHGFGCAMCILRCPTFGPRVSVTAKAGVPEIVAGEGFPHFEGMSGSCKLDKRSLAPWLAAELEEKGVLVLPLPPEAQKTELLGRKACQQYSLREFATNLVVLDTGHVKLMTPYFPLELLRRIRGFEEARFADPYSGGKGNSVRFMAVAPCNDALLVDGVENLFCAGEKTGLLVGHTEAFVTGFLAGHNAVRLLAGKEPLVLPESTASGDLIAFMHREMKTAGGLVKKYTFSGSVYFQRMQEKGLYSTDAELIFRRVARAGLLGVYEQKLL
ncbi:MAG: FAD-dependent oxidoreductase [Desulfotomaculales bacterium]